MNKSRAGKKKLAPRNVVGPRLQAHRAQREPPPPPLLTRIRHKWWFRAAGLISGTFVTISGVVGGLYSIWGPIWPTNPEIHPHDTLNGSSFILPFTVRNTSVLFDMPNVEFTCGVDWVFFTDAKGTRASFTDVAFLNGIYSIATAQMINYPCDASELVKVQTDGSLALRSLPLALPQAVYPPLKIEKMCVWIGGEYKIWGFIPRRFTSVIFQWPAAPNVNQWLEGPTHRVGSKSKYDHIISGAPSETVPCNPEPGNSYVLFTGEIIKQMPGR